ncbi:MAG: fasciclin domain-containing protein, partial [Planctomycetota bacterium]
MLNRSFTALLAAGVLTAGQASAQDIVDTLAGDPQFSTLVTAVQTAGLVDALKGPGPLTVFAPTNAAFDKLPTAELDALLADPGALTQVLLYHVVDGQLLAADVLQGGDATTLANRDVTFSVDNGVPFVNASVISAVDDVVSN